MLDVAISKKMDDGRVMVTASSVATPKIIKEVYLVKEDKADNFIKERKGIEMADRVQKGLSIGSAVVCGMAVASKMKAGMIGKAFGALAAGFGVFKVFEPLDKKLNKMGMENLLKRNDAEIVPPEKAEEVQTENVSADASEQKENIPPEKTEE